MTTQLEVARGGLLTSAMKTVADNEHLDLKELRSRISSGQIVIPANPNHTSLYPIGIGYGLRTKVNANIGTSPIRSDLPAELEKMRVAIEAGADTVMDLSLAGNLDEIRRAVIEESTVPVGTVPIYQAVLEAGSPAELDIGIYLKVFEKHAKDGIDFATVHAGVTKECLPLLQKRLMPSVSRGGTILAKWVEEHGKQSFLYECFDDVIDIARVYDVTISLGDGLRPGCINDATDEAQLYELRILGKLAQRCRDAGVQVMVEGPGHIPLHQIEMNVRLEKELCSGAPFYVLGPLPTDRAAGHDHIAAAIGGALAGMYGADFLCYVTPSEHIGLPNLDDVKYGVIAARIAADAADVAKDVHGARDASRKMSAARASMDWEQMANIAIDHYGFRQRAKEECGSNPRNREYCSMCGEFCTEKRRT